MRALIQQVESASVTVDGEVTGAIAAGLCAFVGVTHDDDESKAKKLADKIWNLRCFDDADGNMNLSAAELNMPVLVVSQFTLYGETSKGRRPSFVAAARPEQAEPVVEATIAALRNAGAHVETGRFRTHMKVALVNDGPTTFSLEV